MISFVGMRQDLHDASGASDITVDTPPGAAAGDFLIAHVATATTTAHTGPAGWTQLGATVTHGNHAASIWLRVATGGEAPDYTWGHGFTRSAARIAAYRGVQAVHDYAPGGTTTSTTSWPTGTVDMPAGGWLLVMPSDRRNAPGAGDVQVWESDDPLDVKRGEVSGATGSSFQVSSALIDSDRPLAADPAAGRVVSAPFTWNQMAVWVVALEPAPEPPPPPEPPAAGSSRWAVPLTGQRPVPLLDLRDGIGQRSVGYRFDLIDAASGRQLGLLHPVADNPPKLDHDVTRTITRTLSLELDPAENARIDTISHRVRPVMVIPGLGEFPLGLFMWADRTEVVRSSGNPSSSELFDQMFIVDQDLDVGFTTRAVDMGDDDLVAVEPVPEALERLLEGLPIQHRITPSPGYSLGSWPAGQSRAQALDALTVDGGYLSPWFDHQGTMRFVPALPPRQVTPTVDWDSGNTIIADSISRSTNLLTAPNRFIVVGNGTVEDPAAAAPIVGIADVPATAPHSISNRGFVVPAQQERQVVSPGQAQLVAQTLATRRTVVETVELDTAADPRHDGHDVILWQGTVWREESWSLTLRAGQPMHHRIRRLYL